MTALHVQQEAGTELLFGVAGSGSSLDRAVCGGASQTHPEGARGGGGPLGGGLQEGQEVVRLSLKGPLRALRSQRERFWVSTGLLLSPSVEGVS